MNPWYVAQILHAAMKSGDSRWRERDKALACSEVPGSGQPWTSSNFEVEENGRHRREAAAASCAAVVPPPPWLDPGHICRERHEQAAPTGQNGGGMEGAMTEMVAVLAIAGDS